MDRSLRRRYGSDNVLRQPLIETSDGRWVRPDNLVIARHGLRAIDRKDVRVLRRSAVEQVADYADVVGEGEIQMSCDTEVPESVAALADLFGIDLTRRRC